MKVVNVLLISLLASVPFVSKGQSQQVDPSVLVGEWTLDMTPHDPSDSAVAYMWIASIDGKEFEGEFYRKGVNITHGHLNTQLPVIYGALSRAIIRAVIIPHFTMKMVSCMARLMRLIENF